MIYSIIRKVSPFPGKSRLMRLFLGKKITDLLDVEIRGKFGYIYKLPNLKESIAFEIFTNGIYEEATSDFIISMLPVDSTFLDLGANIGAVSIPVCKRRPDIKAIGVEASQKVLSYLKHNVRSNNIVNYTVVNKALSHEDGKIVDFFSPDDQFGKGSMSAVFTKNASKIETIRLDSLLREFKLENVGFIKVDVEGYEFQVFRGGEKLLNKPDAPDILFEFVDWAEEQPEGIKPGAAQQLLREYGYEIFYFTGRGKTVPLHVNLTTGYAMLYATKKGKIS